MRRQGGPHGWEPLLYLVYSRLDAGRPGRDPLGVARLLIDHGADPNAGYLWEGLVPPFTALTGAFGGGEGDPPAHIESMALARLLLEAGADPNDGQTLYNCGFEPDDEWLELLFAFGLGTGDGGPWRRRLGTALDAPAEMLEGELLGSSYRGFTHRVGLLLKHGVDPDAPSARHPIHGGRTPAQEAAVWGHPGIVAMLRAAGARTGPDEVDTWLCLATAGDRAGAQKLAAGDPSLVARARARRPEQLVRAATGGQLDAVALLIELGFDVNAVHRTAPLHEAALRGDMSMTELLLAHGADPNVHDASYDATPAGWAEHHGQTEAAEYLAQRENAP